MLKQILAKLSAVEQEQELAANIVHNNLSKVEILPWLEMTEWIRYLKRHALTKVALGAQLPVALAFSSAWSKGLEFDLQAVLSYPLGLLTIILETQDEIDNLRGLMEGSFIRQFHDNENSRLNYSGRGHKSYAVFNPLERLQQDRWWSRAWIFQEEYLSSTAMHLHIPHRPNLTTCPEFGFLRGEVYLNAAALREQANLFLLAFKHGPHQRFSKKCAKLFKTFGKYRIQYHFQHDHGRKAMSPRIFADISIDFM